MRTGIWSYEIFDQKVSGREGRSHSEQLGGGTLKCAGRALNYEDNFHLLEIRNGKNGQSAGAVVRTYSADGQSWEVGRVLVANKDYDKVLESDNKLCNLAKRETFDKFQDSVDEMMSFWDEKVRKNMMMQAINDDRMYLWG